MKHNTNHVKYLYLLQGIRDSAFLSQTFGIRTCPISEIKAIKIGNSLKMILDDKKLQKINYKNKSEVKIDSTTS